MGERPCIRECGETADYGSYLCPRCSRRLRHAIEEAPDLCARIRSSIDPMKAQVYDQEKLSGSGSTESQAPMSLDAVAAADEVLAILTYAAEWFGDTFDYTGRHTFGAGTESADAYHAARFPADYLIEKFDGIVNDDRVGLFASVVLGPVDSDTESWTIARALGRWPEHDRDRWAKQSCPRCNTRMIRVRPPRRFGQPPLFWCKNASCAWEPEKAEHALWAEYFGLTWHVHDWVHLPEYEADGRDEYRCSCSAVAIDVAPGGLGEPMLKVIREADVDVKAEPVGVRDTVTPVRVGRVVPVGAHWDAGLDRDAGRPVCPSCFILQPCGCEETAA